MSVLSLLALLVSAPPTVPILEAVTVPGHDFDVNNCSLYCAAAPDLTVSRHLPPQGRVRYDASCVDDGVRTTAWVIGGGEGEWLQLTFRPEPDRPMSPGLGVNKLHLSNGYHKSLAHWSEHGRVREADLLVDGVVRARIRFLDQWEPQRVDLPDIPLRPGTAFRLVIASVYPGTRFPETAINELRLDGYGHH